MVTGLEQILRASFCHEGRSDDVDKNVDTEDDDEDYNEMMMMMMVMMMVMMRRRRRMIMRRSRIWICPTIQLLITAENDDPFRSTTLSYPMDPSHTLT